MLPGEKRERKSLAFRWHLRSAKYNDLGLVQVSTCLVLAPQTKEIQTDLPF